MSDKLWIALWSVLPVIYLLLALWSKLEQIGGKSRQEHPTDYVSQLFFLIICLFVSILLNRYALDGLIAMLPFSASKGLCQFLLYPAVLFIVSKIWGPTRDILITKATTSHRRR